MSYNKKVFVPPPQFYEFSRLLNFKDQNELIHFSEQRQIHGLTLCMPVQFRCNDGLAFVIPGDDAYPEPVQYVEDAEQTDRTVDATLVEFRQKSIRLNRSEIQGPHDIQLHSNVEISDKHKVPIQIGTENLERAKL